MRLNAEQQHELDSQTMASGVGYEPRFYHKYQWNGPFAYSLRCILCRHEVEHSEEQHNILRCGIEVK